MTFPAGSAKTKKLGKWIWIGLAAVLAVQMYFVQELLAAMIIFSVVFVIGAIGVLVFYLVDRAGQQTVKWAEAQTQRTAQAARKAFLHASEISKKQLHRQRSETAP